MSKLSENLVKFRKLNKLTQSFVAKKIGKAQQTYAMYESAKTEPDSESLIILSRLYGISLDELMGVSTQTPVSKSENDNKVTILGYGLGRKEIELTEEQKQLLTSLVEQFEKSNKRKD